MKTQSRSIILPALALTVLGAGCVGQNRTVFVTRSNVGLDFDSTPPTTEVTIGRKEAVISPSFESGQTPPVMASFHAQTGNGEAFKNFFFGVDQTFAGGDAAVAMATLYNSPEAPKLPADDKPSPYESELSIAEPSSNSWWKRISGPGEANPFIFATDTMFGLKVGWSSAGQVPDSVKAGFNRKEFAWAPLSHGGKTTTTATTTTETTKSADGKTTKTTTSTTETKNTVKVKSPSFLATVDSEAKAEGTSSKTSSIQYFATGKAATLLALQPDVRRAMITRMDPKARFDVGVAVLADTLFSIGTIIGNLATGQNAVALGHQTTLDQLTGITHPAGGVTTYSFNVSTNLLSRQPWASLPSAGWEFKAHTQYLTQLEDNLTALRLAEKALIAGKTVTFSEMTPGSTAFSVPAPLTETIRQQLTADAVADTGRLTKLREELTSHRDVVAAYLYVVSQIAPR